MTALRAVAGWTSPVLLASLAARVFLGDGTAPLLVLITLVAPLLALLCTRACVSTTRVTGGVAALGIGAVLWANVVLIGDLARLAGIERWYALVIGLAVALVPVVVRGSSGWSTAAVPVGLAASALPLIVVAAVTGVTPWSAWSAVASRPAFAFDERSEWVTDGRTLAQATTLTFTEPHRVAAVTPGVYRVVERDDGRAVVREWRLGSGDFLALRPGDRLVLEPGVRVRFEPGKRVPGALASGAVWAEPAAPRAPGRALQFLGATVTLVGGAIALVATSSSTTGVAALGVPLTLLIFVLVPVGWGVYAMYAAPDLSLGAVLLTPLVQMPQVVDAGHGALLATVVGLALVALFIATLDALHRRVEQTAVPGLGPPHVVWSVICLGAFVAGLWSVDPWRVLLAGFGLLAAGLVAPALTVADRRATLIGSTVGTVAFFASILAGPRLAGDFAVIGEYPALVAAPLAWAAVHVARRWEPGVTSP